MPLSDAERAYKREYRLRRIAADPTYRQRESQTVMKARRKALLVRGDEIRARESAWAKARNATDERKDWTANRDLLKHYGIRLTEKLAMYVLQEGRCAIENCRVPLVTMADAKVDHNHDTGKVRALLCSSCNLALGHGRDNAERLRALAAYLDKHQ